MIDNRYENDGKPFLRLNTTQKRAREQYLNKLGGYTNQSPEYVIVGPDFRRWNY